MLFLSGLVLGYLLGAGTLAIMFFLTPDHTEHGPHGGQEG